MVYQEPGRALNPSIKAGRQIAEVYEIADDGAIRALESHRLHLGTESFYEVPLPRG